MYKILNGLHTTSIYKSLNTRYYPPATPQFLSGVTNKTCCHTEGDPSSKLNNILIIHSYDINPLLRVHIFRIAAPRTDLGERMRGKLTDATFFGELAPESLPSPRRPTFR
jgi:hypothetical protein